MKISTFILLFLIGILVSCSSNKKDKMKEIYEDFSDKPEVYPRK
jgi:hypothetical protein